MCSKPERVVGGDDAVVVDLEAGQRARHGAGRQQHVVGLDDCGRRPAPRWGRPAGPRPRRPRRRASSPGPAGPCRAWTTTLPLYSLTLGTSMPSKVPLTPKVSASRMVSATSAACSSALVGMQPRCRQVPPTLSFSTITTDRPELGSRAARRRTRRCRRRGSPGRRGCRSRSPQQGSSQVVSCTRVAQTAPGSTAAPRRTGSHPSTLRPAVHGSRNPARAVVAGAGTPGRVAASSYLVRAAHGCPSPDEEGSCGCSAGRAGRPRRPGGTARRSASRPRAPRAVRREPPRRGGLRRAPHARSPRPRSCWSRTTGSGRAAGCPRRGPPSTWAAAWRSRSTTSRRSATRAGCGSGPPAGGRRGTPRRTGATGAPRRRGPGA